jgi:hypothetical protein
LKSLGIQIQSCRDIPMPTLYRAISEYAVPVSIDNSN